MSADGTGKPGETLRLLTTQVVGGIEQAREKLQALAKSPATSLAELDRLNAASRAMAGAIDTRVRSAIDLSGIEESQRRIAAFGKEFAEASAKQQEMLDRVARNFGTLWSAAVPSFPSLGITDPSEILDDSIDRFATRISPPPPSPIYETNSNLEQMLTYNEKILANSEKMVAMQLDLTKVHQSLNDTTFAFLSEFRNVVRRTSKQTWLIIIVAVFTLAINGVGIWSTFTSSDDIATANQQMLEGLTDRVATIASQQAADREAMFAEQRRLLEQLSSTTQARIEQNAAEQRAAIQEPSGVLSQKEAPSEAPIDADIGPP